MLGDWHIIFFFFVISSRHLCSRSVHTQLTELSCNNLRHEIEVNIIRASDYLTEIGTMEIQLELDCWRRALLLSAGRSLGRVTRFQVNPWLALMITSRL